MDAEQFERSCGAQGDDRLWYRDNKGWSMVMDDTLERVKTRAQLACESGTGPLRIVLLQKEEWEDEDALDRILEEWIDKDKLG
jgi:hypothetical protein